MHELSGEGNPANIRAEHLIFDHDALESAENGVFGFSFLSSAKAAVQHLRGTSAAGAAILHSDQEQTHELALQHLARVLEDNRSSSSAQRQRRLLWRIGSSSRHAHVAQSKLEFVVASHNAGECGFVYDRTGWATYSSDHCDGDSSVNGDDDAKEAVSVEIQSRTPNTQRTPGMMILGTGSAAPSKLRASSSIYVELPNVHTGETHQPPASLLLDCGEGTFGQLWRQFGPATSERIAGVRCIWISHHHADHQCGLVRILHEYCRHYHQQPRGDLRRLVVIAPQSVLTYLEHWLPSLLERTPASSFIETITCREFNDLSNPIRRRLLDDIGYAVSSMSSIPVRHCYDSYGFVLTTTVGKKLVYSGDTQPCNQLVIAGVVLCCLGCSFVLKLKRSVVWMLAGMRASVLIHEATFDDSMEDDARMKRHSTVGEAIDIARRMQAEHVILTHFSQRYPSLPPSGAVTSVKQSSREPNIICAYDGFAFPLPLWL